MSWGVRDVLVWMERCRRAHGQEGVTLWRHGTAAIVGRTRPDAFLTYALGSRKLAALVEMDRGMERGEKWWADKLARFGEILTSDLFYELTGLKQERVLVIAPTVARGYAICGLLHSLMGAAPSWSGRSGLPTRVCWRQTP